MIEATYIETSHIQNMTGDEIAFALVRTAEAKLELTAALNESASPADESAIISQLVIHTSNESFLMSRIQEMNYYRGLAAHEERELRSEQGI